MQLKTDMGQTSYSEQSPVYKIIIKNNNNKKKKGFYLLPHYATNNSHKDEVIP